MSKKEHMLLFAAMLAFVIIGGFSMWKHSQLQHALGAGDHSLAHEWAALLLIAVVGQISLIGGMRSLQRKLSPSALELAANVSPSQELPPSIR